MSYRLAGVSPSGLADSYSPKQRTALVLSGTGTAGAYHAGVLRALQEAGVKLDVVATGYLFVGFTDTISTTVEAPIFMNGAALDSDATNACGIVWDADATLDVLYVGGVKADVDTAVTELDQDATAELLAARTAINGLVTEVHANPFAETLSRLSAYKGSPAYTHLETLLHEKAQNFGR